MDDSKKMDAFFPLLWVSHGTTVYNHIVDT